MRTKNVVASTKIRRIHLTHHDILVWILKILVILAGLRVILTEAASVYAAIAKGI